MQRYENWVVANNGLVEKLEGLCHTLFFLSPTRVRDSEIRSESMYTGVNLLSLYHEHIRHKHGIGTGRLGGVTLTALRAVQMVEVMAEMAGIIVLGHGRAKWRLILAIELLKMGLRAILLRERRGAMLIEQVGRDPSDFSSQAKPADPFQTIEQQRGGQTQQVVGRRSGVCFRTRSGGTQGQRGSQQELLAELLHMSRPVVYLLACLKAQKSAWWPWVLSLAMDLLQLRLRHAEGPRSALEAEEVSRRRGDLQYYLLRDPVYKSFTKPLATLVHLRVLSKIPLIGAISELFLGISESMNALHFYKAAS